MAPTDFRSAVDRSHPFLLWPDSVRQRCACVMTEGSAPTHAPIGVFPDTGSMPVVILPNFVLYVSESIGHVKSSPTQKSCTLVIFRTLGASMPSDGYLHNPQIGVEGLQKFIHGEFFVVIHQIFDGCNGIDNVCLAHRDDAAAAVVFCPPPE